jgi:hypothetical protein
MKHGLEKSEANPSYDGRYLCLMFRTMNVAHGNIYEVPIL